MSSAAHIDRAGGKGDNIDNSGRDIDSGAAVIEVRDVAISLYECVLRDVICIVRAAAQVQCQCVDARTKAPYQGIERARVTKSRCCDQGIGFVRAKLCSGMRAVAVLWVRKFAFAS